MDESGKQEQIEGSSPVYGETSTIPHVKGRFPFRLGTTSYIIPAPIMPNLRLLGPHLDEVELVLFESGREDNLPSRSEIREMRQTSLDLDFKYNVHLPADVFLGDPDPLLRQKFRETILRFYERALPLDPTIFILHLDSRNANGSRREDLSAWVGRVWESIDKVVQSGVDPHRVAVENLEYPLETISPIVESFEMSFCLDLGHLMRYGYDLAEQMRLFLGRSSAVHLHGVRGDGVDHVGVQWIPPREWQLILESLKSYRHCVSLEVFSLDDLVPSLGRIEDSLNGG
jgi:sugar phosphate isomerase/epimerase